MARVEDITVGLNRFTPERWRHMWDTVLRVEQFMPLLESLRREQAESKRLVLPAFILGYEKTDDNRWQYAWHEAVEESGTGQLAIKTGGLNSYNDDFDANDTSAGTPFHWPARNLVENSNGNDGVVSGGVNLDGIDYPEAFCLQAIRGRSNGNPCCDEGCSPDDSETDGPEHWLAGQGPGCVMFLFRDNEGVVLPRFALMNQHDGACEVVVPGPAASTESGGLPGIDSGVRRVLQDYTVTSTDTIILVDASRGAVTITLRAVTVSSSQSLYIKKVDSSGNAVTVQPESEKIEGSSSITVSAQYDGISIVSDDANWFVVSNKT